MKAIKSSMPSVGLIALSGQLDLVSIIGSQKFSDVHLCKPVNIDILCEGIIKLYNKKNSGKIV